MKMRKKNDCFNCRALRGNSYGHGHSCGLGYQIEDIKKSFGGPREFLYIPTPTEICPKPISWKAWMNAEPKEKKAA